MADNDTFYTHRLTGDTLVSSIDEKFSELEQTICNVFGFTIDSSISGFGFKNDGTIGDTNNPILYINCNSTHSNRPMGLGFITGYGEKAWCFTTVLGMRDFTINKIVNSGGTESLDTVMKLVHTTKKVVFYGNATLDSSVQTFGSNDLVPKWYVDGSGGGGDISFFDLTDVSPWVKPCGHVLMYVPFLDKPFVFGPGLAGTPITPVVDDSYYNPSAWRTVGFLNLSDFIYRLKYSGLRNETGQIDTFSGIMLTNSQFHAGGMEYRLMPLWVDENNSVCTNCNPVAITYVTDLDLGDKADGSSLVMSLFSFTIPVNYQPVSGDNSKTDMITLLQIKTDYQGGASFRYGFIVPGDMRGEDHCPTYVPSTEGE